jgi:hypothetical protein
MPRSCGVSRDRRAGASWRCQGQGERHQERESLRAPPIPIPVIWTCKESSGRDLHFDTRQYNHIMWKEPGELHEKLLARIGAVLGDGPGKKR